MAIAGAIGTGLIIGTGSALANGGPGSLLIAYLIMGFVVYTVMVALGEMGAWLPHKKSFSGYATRFVDPAMGYVWERPVCRKPNGSMIGMLTCAIVSRPAGTTSSNTSLSCPTT